MTIKHVKSVIWLFQNKLNNCINEKVLSIATSIDMVIEGSCHKRQKPQAPTPQAPIRNRLTRKVANAINRNTKLT